MSSRGRLVCLRMTTPEPVPTMGSDTRFGEHLEMRWLEVAPPGSHERLSLNPPMGAAPGGGSIGVETP